MAAAGADLLGQVSDTQLWRGAATVAAVRARLGHGARAGGKENAKAEAGEASALLRAALGRAKAEASPDDAKLLLECAESALGCLTSTWPSLKARPAELEAQRYAFVRQLASRKLHGHALSHAGELYARLAALTTPAKRKGAAQGQAAALEPPNARRATKPSEIATLVLGAALCRASSACEAIDEAPEGALRALAVLARDEAALAAWVALAAGGGSGAAKEQAAQKHWASLYRCLYRAAGRALQLSPGPYADLVAEVAAGAVRACARAGEAAQAPALAAKLAGAASKGAPQVARAVMEAALDALTAMGDRAALPLCSTAEGLLKTARDDAMAVLSRRAREAGARAAPACAAALAIYAAAGEIGAAQAAERPLNTEIMDAAAVSCSDVPHSPAPLRALDSLRRGAAGLVDRLWDAAVVSKFARGEVEAAGGEARERLVEVLGALARAVAGAAERKPAEASDATREYALKLRSSAAAAAILATRCAAAAGSEHTQAHAAASLAELCAAPLADIGADVMGWLAANAYNVGAQLSNAKHKARALPLLRAAASAARRVADAKPGDAALARSAQQKAAAVSTCEAAAAQAGGGLSALAACAAEAAKRGDAVDLAAATRQIARACREDFCHDTAAAAELPSMLTAVASADAAFDRGDGEQLSEACRVLLWAEADAWGAATSRGAAEWQVASGAARRRALEALASPACDVASRALGLLQLAEDGDGVLDGAFDELVFTAPDGVPSALVVAAEAQRLAAALSAGDDEGATGRCEALAHAVSDVIEGGACAERAVVTSVRLCLDAADAAYLRGRREHQAASLAAAALVAGNCASAGAEVVAVRVPHVAALVCACGAGGASPELRAMLDAGRKRMLELLAGAEPSAAPFALAAELVQDPELLDSEGDAFESLASRRPAAQLAAAHAYLSRGAAADAQFWASCAADAYRKIGGSSSGSSAGGLADTLEALEALARAAAAGGSIEEAERALRESRTLSEAAGAAAASHLAAAISGQAALAIARGSREDAERLAEELEAAATTSLPRTLSQARRTALSAAARYRGDCAMSGDGSGALLAALTHYDTALEQLDEPGGADGVDDRVECVSDLGQVAVWLSLDGSERLGRARCELARARLHVRLGDANEARASLVSVLESLAAIEGSTATAALGELEAPEEETAAAAAGAPLPRVAPAETAHALILLAALELRTVGADAGAVWAEVAPGGASCDVPAAAAPAKGRVSRSRSAKVRAAPRGKATAKDKGKGKAASDEIERAKALLRCAVRRASQLPPALRAACAALAAAWRRPSVACSLPAEARDALAAVAHFAAVGAAPRQQHALALREKRARALADGSTAQGDSWLRNLAAALTVDVRIACESDPVAAAEAVDDALGGLPDGCCVCAVSLCDACTSVGAAGSESARAMVCRLERGRPPRFTAIAAGADVARIAIEVDELVLSAVAHARDAAPAPTASAATKRKWWTDRVAMDRKLSAMLRELTSGKMAALPLSIFGRTDDGEASEMAGDDEGEVGAAVAPEAAAPAVLVLDAPLAHLPWESTPALAGYRLYRSPCLATVRAASVMAASMPPPPKGAVAVADLGRAYYVLDPGGDLATTRATLEPWLRGLEGWRGVSGERPPAPEALARELRDAGLYAYFGHGGGEQYLGKRRLAGMGGGSSAAPAAAPALLMGCSSGALRPKGARCGVEASTGGALAYLQAGCPSAVANLWDVTDKDIDRFSTALLADWLRTAEGAGGGDDIARALPAARAACRLPHLIGAAPVCYGVPTALAARRE